MAESNLIQFKRGTMAALETLIASHGGIDGTFYLTIDDDASGSNTPNKSSRLFVGRSNGDIVPVNQGIITVTNLSDLTNNIEGKWHAGDYAYVTTGNILAIYDGKTWKQINAVGENFFTNDFKTFAEASNNVATVTPRVYDNQMGNDIEHYYDAAFEIDGANGIQVTATNRTSDTPAKVTITGDTYELSRSAAASNQTTISLDSENTDNNSAVTIKGGDRVTVTTSGDNVIELESKNFEVTEVAIGSEGTGFTVGVTQAYDADATVTSQPIDPTIVLGTNTSSPIHFVDGTATLPVYTKDEIDAQKKALNAMVYKGTVGTIDAEHVGSYAASIAAMEAPSVGDTFKIIGSNNTLPAEKSADGKAHTLKEGDVLIANGTEDPTTGLITSGLVFDVIPAGDEVDSQYEFTGIEHGVQLTGNYDAIADKGSFALAAGTQIELEDNNDSTDKVVTVKHTTITTAAATTNAATNATTQQNSGNLTLPVISNISIDNGHVTGWTIQNYEVIDTSVEIGSMSTVASAENNVATVATTLNYTTQLGADATADSSFTVSSDNLNVTASGSDVKVNFV